jgi:hypothetical protein
MPVERVKSKRITTVFAFACARGYPYLDSSGGQTRDGLFMNRFWSHDKVRDRRDMSKVIFVGFDPRTKEFVFIEEKVYSKPKQSGNKPRFGDKSMSPNDGTGEEVSSGFED